MLNMISMDAINTTEAETTTKRSYINQHPKNMLANSMDNNDWPDDTPINVIGGLNAPNNRCSNLSAALGTAKLKKYCLGGHRQRGTEGWWIAVA